MKPFIPFSLICLLIVSFSSCIIKEKSGNEQVKQYEKFVSEMKSRGFNTGNILVYEKGEVIFESSNGLRTINPIDSLTLESQFRLASVSKQFTGVAMMKLKQAGKLDYDQKVNTILPDFPYDNISIRHLLHHTSGLDDYEEIIEEYFIPQDPTKRYILGNNEILKIFFDVNPDLIFQPGEEWEYSNTGYMILASIVEKVSGQHFRFFLKDNIFDPLGMSNTTLYNYQEGDDPNMPNRVFGYQKALNQKDYKLNDYDIVNDVRGDGGIYSTLEDLYKWNLALVNYKTLPKDYMDEAWSWGILNNSEKTRYGFGWNFPKDKTAPKAVFHSGGWVGFGTFLYNEIETKSGYIVLTNNSWESFDPIIDAIDSIRVGAPYVLQKRSIGKYINL
jgi:CubicO group peptidase (beta-lactamase class C family)